jgi:N-acetylmuramoyl-L-alanine amidase
MNKSVYLSPSTQENNVGAGNYGTEEFRMNAIADVTERELKCHGITVHRNNPNMTLQQVVADSNAEEVSIHFAIHSNAGGGRGCEVYCNKFGGNGEKLARIIYNKISPLTPTSDRGVHEGYNFYGAGKHMYELAYTNAPASLIEIAYHDNIDDANWIINNIENIGIALAKGILEYFGIAYNQESDAASAIYKNGSQGEVVKVIQQKINDYFNSLRIDVDGVFGPKTENAVKIYQQLKKLEVDGIVGPQTQKSLGM